MMKAARDYSDEELREAHESVDAEAHHARAAELRAEIARRRNLSRHKNQREYDALSEKSRAAIPVARRRFVRLRRTAQGAWLLGKVGVLIASLIFMKVAEPDHQTLLMVLLYAVSIAYGAIAYSRLGRFPCPVCARHYFKAKAPRLRGRFRCSNCGFDLWNSAAGQWDET
jgi:predicted RNA-binding Zn-ribbon protein involved in translation (DUF1610 family)